MNETSRTSPDSKKTRDEIADAYKSPPWWYDIRGFFILTFAYNNTIWSQLKFFGGNFGAKHLEVACGTGTLLELVLRWRRWKRLPDTNVVGVDYAESMLAGANHRFKERKDIVLLHGDAADLPFTEGIFDTANIANSVHCFPDVDGALRGVHRVLKPGGTLAANVLLYPTNPGVLGSIANRVNNWGMKKGILFTPYRKEDFQAFILAAGFEIISLTTIGNCCNIKAQKPISVTEKNSPTA